LTNRRRTGTFLRVPLDEELVEAAERASRYGRVTGVLAAEPVPGRRSYLVALDAPDGGSRWIALDAAGRPLERLEEIRSVASIVAICELAGDVAGGGDLAALREELERVRVVEGAASVEPAERAALELERAVGAPPRVASPAYLDEVGAAAAQLERALGDSASPFSSALRGGTGAVEEFVRDVERGYAADLP
jgi:hypothetical protein